MKGKSREDEPSDAELALQLCKHELEVKALIILHRRMAQSIASAVQTHGPLVRETLYWKRVP